MIEKINLFDRKDLYMLIENNMIVIYKNLEMVEIQSLMLSNEINTLLDASLIFEKV